MTLWREQPSSRGLTVSICYISRVLRTAIATLQHRRTLIHHIYQLVDDHLAYNREILSGKFCIDMRRVLTCGRDDTFAGAFQSKGKVSCHQYNGGTLAL